MPRKATERLTDGQLAEILTAPDDEPTAALARRIGGEYFTVTASRRRLRRGEWRCTIYWSTCVVCGESIAGQSRQTTHVRCLPERARQRSRQRRADRAAGSLSTPYVARWRKDHPGRARQLRDVEKATRRDAWRVKSRDEQLDDLAKAHEADAIAQERTAQIAHNTGAAWSADDDAWLIEHNHLPARNIALTLSRTLWSVKKRRTYLRKRGLLD
jgi:hypothetical protein